MLLPYQNMILGKAKLTHFILLIITLFLASAKVDLCKTLHFLITQKKKNRARKLKFCTILALVLEMTCLKSQTRISIKF